MADHDCAKLGCPKSLGWHYEEPELELSDETRAELDEQEAEQERKLAEDWDVVMGFSD